MLVSFIFSKGSPSGLDGEPIPVPDHAWVRIVVNGVTVIEKHEITSPFSLDGASRTYVEFPLEFVEQGNYLEITNLPESNGAIRLHAFCAGPALIRSWHTAYVNGTEIKNESDAWINVERVGPGSVVKFYLDDLR